ncbi:MAG: DUF4173 domain-containing protein [Thermoguttaceae bacterium]|nr:DUF4173 domain-containing protein [Thermoguttaceae bacterium]
MYIIAFLCLFTAACVWLVGTRSWKAEFQPVSWREFLAALCGAAAFIYFVYNCRITYRTVHAGSAVFLALMIPVFVLGGSSRKNWKLLLALSLMLAFSAFRILCIGCVDGNVTELCALLLVFVLAAVCCETPMKREVLSRYFFSSVWRAVPRGLRNFQFVLHLPQFNLFSRVGCAAVLVPAFLVLVFGTIFALANPAILEWFRAIFTWLDHILKHFDEFIRWLLDQHIWRQVFVFLVAFCGLCGLLAPRIWTPAPSCSQFPELELKPESAPVTPAHIAMYWNSLFALIILFAVELTYEFSSLLTWKIPEGFDYGRYCHEGAFWLTMALGLATLVLAGIFRQKVCKHEKINSLKRLAFIWIAENALLAVTIYIRLGIYVHRSGLTCLRVVGFFGTTAVAVGIVWMALKLRKDRPAGWLLSRYTWTVAAIIWIYSVLPVDFIVWKYNVAALQAGNKAVLVHVTDQPISAEGLIPLFDLLQSEDAVVRNGVAAVIAMDEPKKNSGDWRNHFLLEARLRQLYEDPNNQKILEEFRGNESASGEMRQYGERHYR